MKYLIGSNVLMDAEAVAYAGFEDGKLTVTLKGTNHPLVFNHTESAKQLFDLISHYMQEKNAAYRQD